MEVPGLKSMSCRPSSTTDQVLGAPPCPRLLSIFLQTLHFLEGEHLSIQSRSDVWLVLNPDAPHHQTKGPVFSPPTEVNQKASKDR